MKQLKRLLHLTMIALLLSSILSLTSYADSTVVVSSSQELFAALKDPAVDNIEFGIDIELETSIIFNIETRRTNPDLTINGNGYTLTEYFISTINTTSGLTIMNNASNSTLKSVTLKNFSMIYGGNGAGNIFVTESFTGNKAITLNYENLSYVGPKVAYNPFGTVTFTDTNITIEPAKVIDPDGVVMKTGNFVGDVVEASSIHIAGKNDIFRKEIPSSVNEYFSTIFKIRPSGIGTAGIFIEPYASVNIINESKNKGHYASFLFTEHINTLFELGEYAVFQYSGYQNFNYMKDLKEFNMNPNSVAHILIEADNRPMGYNGGVFRSQNMSIREHADLSIATNGNTSHSSLMVRSELTVDDDASLKVLALNNHASAKQAALSVGTNSTTPVASIRFNNPKSVLIYNSKLDAPAISFAAKGYFESTVNQIEYWNSAALAGDYNNLTSDTASHIWSQQSDFTVNAHIANGNILEPLTHIHYDGNHILDHNTFSFKDQSVVHIHSVPATPPVKEQSKKPTIDTIVEMPALLTGTGTAGSEIKITLPNGDEITTTVLSGGVWYFILPRDTTFQIGDRISITQTETGKDVSDIVIGIVISKDI